MIFVLVGALPVLPGILVYLVLWLLIPNENVDLSLLAAVPASAEVVSSSERSSFSRLA